MSPGASSHGWSSIQVCPFSYQRESDITEAHLLLWQHGKSSSCISVTVLGGSGTQEDTKFHREVLRYSLVAFWSLWPLPCFPRLSPPTTPKPWGNLEELLMFVIQTLKFLITTPGSQKKKGWLGILPDGKFSSCKLATLQGLTTVWDLFERQVPIKDGKDWWKNGCCALLPSNKEEGKMSS